eukprot:CAMPEP_0197182190 /NCGR_PEP_ID=MMETSP1423-20130617/6232_1 /TAXON_ID=476441 /ORGANISM="Pseudo-nitzschia heimii, Strain UNC1101" /LENGTH=1023 /DNA_ID=CAMNT_0042632573 /DNA_START=342 /DNA_END=3413 /DNA_ORIENTATION=+
MAPPTSPAHSNHQSPQDSHSRNGRTKEDGSAGSENSTVPELLRSIIPLNHISALFPNTSSNLFRSSNNGNTGSGNNINHRVPSSTSGAAAHHSSSRHSRSNDRFPAENLGPMLFDAVPFNGDTDNEGANYNANTNSPIRGSGSAARVVDFTDMDIHVPMKRVFGSNISPIGNVSSRGYNVVDDDESDDDLDRILGRMDNDDDDGGDRIKSATTAEAAVVSGSTGTGAFRKRLAAAEAINGAISNTQQQQQQQRQQQEQQERRQKQQQQMKQGNSSRSLNLNRTLSTEGSLLDEPPSEGIKPSLAMELAAAATNILLREEEEEDECTTSSTMVAPRSWPRERSLQIQQRFHGNNLNLDLNKDYEDIEQEYSPRSGGNHSHWRTKLRRRFRKRTYWLIALVVFLTLILAIMLGTIFGGSNQKKGERFSNQAVASSINEEGIVTQDENRAPSSVAETRIPTAQASDGQTPTPTPVNQPSSFLRPSQGRQPRPSSKQDLPMQPPSLTPTSGGNLLATSSPTATQESLEEVPPNPTPDDALQGSSNSKDYADRLSSAQRLPQVRLDMGPLIGHTTHESASLWAYYQTPAIYESKEDDYVLEILLYDADGWIRTINEARPDGNRNYAVFVTLTGLEALTTYRYEMRILGKIVGSGSFRTAPPPLSNQQRNRRRRLQNQHYQVPLGDSDRTYYGGSTFEYILASSMDLSEQPIQKAWEAIPTIRSNGIKVYPDFALLAGDTIYLDEDADFDPNNRAVRFDRYWHRSTEQRNEPHFADFVANTPVYAVWNDRDYGTQGATKDQSGKEESLRAWNALWPNPTSSGNSNQYNGQNYYEIHKVGGIYYSFYWGDVHYIVTDDRWNRDPYRENRWGVEQTNWIRSELVSSTGTFKVIVLGSDVMERGYATDLENIGVTIWDHSIEGVIFHAGDSHRNEYKRQDTGVLPYPVTQITSSGIAKVWRKPFVKISVDTTSDDPTMTARFFGATSMDEDDPTWANDPSLVCSAIEGMDPDKEHSCTETIRLSDLTLGAAL